LRAAIRAGWKTIPARIRDADDRLVAELAIVENLQRKDLNAIEKALSFRRYIDQHKCTQEDLARRLKIDRSTVTNLMRLLELPTLVQDALRNGALTAGHARALLPLGDEHQQIEFCNRIQNQNLNVRQTEQMVADHIAAEDQSDAAKKKRTKSHQIESLQQELKMALGTRVEIRPTKRGNGRIVIHFQNPREFERIRQTIGANPQKQAG
jgi:ParB family chromosome partitioning protein